MIEPVEGGAGLTVTGIRGRSGPFRSLAIPLAHGLTALYGLNGSGKTTVLNIARSAAHGITQGTDSAHITLEIDAGSALDRRIAALASTTLERDHDFATRLPLGWSAERSRAHPDDIHAVLALAIEHWFRTGGAAGVAMRRELGDFSVDSSAISKELLRSRSFVLAATGVTEPRWDVWLAVPYDSDEFPVTWAEFARARAVAEKSLADPEPDAASVAGWVEVTSPAWGWIWRSDDAVNAIDNGIYSPLWDFTLDGLAVPIVYLGSLSGTAPVVVLDENSQGPVDAVTASALAHHVDEIRSLRRFAIEGGFEQEVLDSLNEDVGALTFDGLRPSRAVEKVLTRWGNQASKRYQAFLQDNRTLRIISGDLQAWLRGDGLYWTVGGLRLDQLSRAQRRWAQWAIALTVAPTVDLVLLDEPEAALHRSGEDHLARILSHPDLAQQPWLVATHSPMILDAAGTHRVEISQSLSIDRDTPVFTATARPLTPPDLESLERLGMHPSDLLRSDRVFVLVEGLHDEIIFNTLLGDVLRTSHARILPLRGGRLLKTAVDGSFLVRYTDAYLLAVLDNLSAGHVQSTWDTVQLLALADTSVAIDHLIQELPRRVAENKFLVEFLTTALGSDLATRAKPFGLTAEDVIEYLPVCELVPRGPQDWSELRKLYRGRTPDGAQKQDFKSWLARTYGANFAASDIRRAAERVRGVPEDIRALAETIRELGDGPPLNRV